MTKCIIHLIMTYFEKEAHLVTRKENVILKAFNIFLDTEFVFEENFMQSFSILLKKSYVKGMISINNCYTLFYTDDVQMFKTA